MLVRHVIYNYVMARILQIQQFALDMALVFHLKFALVQADGLVRIALYPCVMELIALPQWYAPCMVRVHQVTIAFVPADIMEANANILFALGINQMIHEYARLEMVLA